jgi:hypothetical protein
MAIMPTGMHLSCIPARMGKHILLRHGKGIHIGPKTNASQTLRGWPGACSIDYPHHPSPSEALHNLIDSQESELLGDTTRCALLLKPQLWVGMNIASKCDELFDLKWNIFGVTHVPIIP